MIKLIRYLFFILIVKISSCFAVDENINSLSKEIVIRSAIDQVIKLNNIKTQDVSVVCVIDTKQRYIHGNNGPIGNIYQDQLYSYDASVSENIQKYLDTISRVAIVLDSLENTRLYINEVENNPYFIYERTHDTCCTRIRLTINVQEPLEGWDFIEMNPLSNLPIRAPYSSKEKVVYIPVYYSQFHSEVKIKSKYYLFKFLFNCEQIIPTVKFLKEIELDTSERGKK